MKKKITSIALCAIAAVAAAQTPNIEVSYVAHHPNFRDGKTDLTNQYVLLANVSESKFYSPITEYLDSLNSTPEGKAKLKTMSRTALSSGNFDNIPKRDGTIYVVKSFEEGKIKHYDSAGLEKYFYEEDINQWNWNIGDSTKTIFGYECIIASTYYNGRKWTVWFSPEIPIPNGPWKLDGLPGLILEAEAEGGQYSFFATGIQQTNNEIRQVYLANEYERTTRLNYLKAKRSFLDNPRGKLNAQFGGNGMSISMSDGAELKDLYVAASVADFLETDYH